MPQDDVLPDDGALDAALDTWDGTGSLGRLLGVQEPGLFVSPGRCAALAQRLIERATAPSAASGTHRVDRLAAVPWQEWVALPPALLERLMEVFQAATHPATRQAGLARVLEHGQLPRARVRRLLRSAEWPVQVAALVAARPWLSLDEVREQWPHAQATIAGLLAVESVQGLLQDARRPPAAVRSIERALTRLHALPLEWLAAGVRPYAGRAVAYDALVPLGDLPGPVPAHVVALALAQHPAARPEAWATAYAAFTGFGFDNLSLSLRDPEAPLGWLCWVATAPDATESTRRRAWQGVLSGKDRGAEVYAQALRGLLALGRTEDLSWVAEWLPGHVSHLAGGIRDTALAAQLLQLPTRAARQAALQVLGGSGAAALEGGGTTLPAAPVLGPKPLRVFEARSPFMA